VLAAVGVCAVAFALCGVLIDIMIRQQVLSALTQDAARAARHVVLQIATMPESIPIRSLPGDSDLIQVVRANGDVVVSTALLEGRSALSMIRPEAGPPFTPATGFCRAVRRRPAPPGPAP
jgi:hypothetical protein